MPLWSVTGGHELKGSLEVQGSKNAVLPIMAASLVGGGVTRLENCPRLLDVEASREILRYLGCAVTGSGGEIGHIHLEDGETEQCGCGRYGYFC